MKLSVPKGESPVHVTRQIHNSAAQIWDNRNIGFK